MESVSFADGRRGCKFVDQTETLNIGTQSFLAKRKHGVEKNAASLLCVFGKGIPPSSLAIQMVGLFSLLTIFAQPDKAFKH